MAKQMQLIKQFEISLRQKRFNSLIPALSRLPKPIRVLDVGGTLDYWNDLHSQVALRVTLLNRFPQHNLPEKFISVVGDALNLRQFKQQEFDFVVSNSVLGHVGGFAQQQQMANEIQQLATSYAVQTPNRYFPIDWRTLFPGFHLLPQRLQAFMVYGLPLLRFKCVKPYSSAINWAKSVRNVTRREMQLFFPDAQIKSEKILGVTKSFTALRIAPVVKSQPRTT